MRPMIFAVATLATLASCALVPNKNTQSRISPAETLPPPTPAPTDAPMLPPTNNGTLDQILPLPQPLQPQVLATPQPVPPLAVSECYKAPDDFTCRVELAVVRMTNELRGSGRPPLRHAKKLSFVARDWSIAQAARRNINHSGFPRQRVTVYEREFASAAGVGLSAENVGMTGFVSPDPETMARELTNMWWGSSGHRRNMQGAYQTLGVGIAVDSRGSVYATQIFGSGGE